MVHPLPGPNSKHKLTLIKAKQNLRAADKARTRKKKKYDVICAQNGLKFLPIIEFTGKMHPPLQDFLAVVMDIMTMNIISTLSINISPRSTGLLDYLAVFKSR